MATTADTGAEAKRRPEAAGLDSPARPTWGQLAAAAFVTVYGTLLAWSMLWVATAGANPWPAYWAAAAVGALGCVVNRDRLRAWSLAFPGAMWAIWLVTMPWAPFWAWDNGAGPAALASAQAAGLAMLALVGVGLRHPLSFRWMWLAITLTTAPVALWETRTGIHLYGWAGNPTAPVTVFVNTNNYAAVLVLCVGVFAGWALTARSRTRRLTMAVLAALCAWLTWRTGSRMALLGVAAVMALTAVTAYRTALLRRSTPPWLVRLGARARAHHLTRWSLVAGSVLVVVAFLAWLLPLLFPGDESTLRSDNLRRNLIVYAFGLWREYPLLGSGAGSFEGLWKETGGPIVPPHNGFVELLAENGILVAGWLFALTIWLAVLSLLPAHQFLPRGSGAPTASPGAGAELAPGASSPDSTTSTQRLQRVVAVQHLLASQLIGFVLAGSLVSSPLPWFPWWLMLAGAVAAGAWLEVERRAGRSVAAG